MKNIDLRVKKGSITYDRLAEQLDVSRMTVHNWFNKENLGEVERQRLLIAIEEIKEAK